MGPTATSLLKSLSRNTAQFLIGPVTPCVSMMRLCHSLGPESRSIAKPLRPRRSSAAMFEEHNILPKDDTASEVTAFTVTGHSLKAICWIVCRRMLAVQQVVEATSIFSRQSIQTRTE